MRKIIILFLLSLLILNSCSKNKELSIEERALRQRQITLSNEFKNAAEFKITDDKIVYKSDSVVLIHFYMEGYNDKGFLTSGRMEYAYQEVTLWAFGHPELKVWDDYFIDIDKEGSSIDMQKELIKSTKDAGLDSDIFEESPYNMFSSALFSMSRKVPSQFTKEVEQLKVKK